MMGTINKIIKACFMGLLLCGIFSHYAFAQTTAIEEQDSDTLDQATVIKAQDPWSYMRDHIDKAGYSSFVKTFGDKEDAIATIIQCGKELCNLDVAVCLYKTRSTGRTTRYRYICVPKEKEDESVAAGWQPVNAETHQNVKRIRIGKNKNKSKIYKNVNCYDAVNPHGVLQKYCAEVIDDKVEIHSGNAKGNGCDVVPVSWYNNQKCRFCPLLGPVFRTADYMSEISRNTLAYSFAILIVVGLAIWIAMKTVIFVSSFTKQDAAKYITDMLKQSYKFMIAFFLLISYNDVFNYIVNPLLKAGLDFGTAFVKVDTVERRLNVSSVSKEAFEALGEKLPADYALNLDNSYYNVSMYAKLENLAYNVNKQYALLQTIGSGLNCLGWKYMTMQFGLGDGEIGLGFACIIYGICFSCFGFLLSIAFIFYIFDAVVQLGIVGALLPFLIASWPFKITSRYTSTGFKMLLNSIFTFMMIGLVVKISMTLIIKAVELNFSVDAYDASIVDLIKAMDNIEANRLKKMVNVLSVGFLLFLFANILGFLLLARVSELVNRFASGGMKPAAPYMATTGASAIKGAALKVSAPTRKAVNEWAHDKVEKVSSKAIDKAIGLVTLRPVRKWAYNKADDAISKRSAANQASDNSSLNTKGSGAEAASTVNKKAVLGKGGKLQQGQDGKQQLQDDKQQQGSGANQGQGQISASNNQSAVLGKNNNTPPASPAEQGNSADSTKSNSGHLPRKKDLDELE